MKRIQSWTWLFIVVTFVLFIVFVDCPETDWIKTDKDQYLTGEEVIIYFTNRKDVSLERGFWGIKDAADVIRDMRIWIIEPGETFVWVWDQTYQLSDDPRNSTQVPSGKYTIWWRPQEITFDQQSQCSSFTLIGPFTYEFEIIDRLQDGEP